MPAYKQEYAPDVKVSVTGNDEDAFSVTENDGTITNRLYGETVINGEKLWKEVSPLLQKAEYPIAKVTLFRDVSELTQDEQADLHLTEEEISSGLVQISEPTLITSGDTTFKFSEAVSTAINHQGAVSSNSFVIMENNSVKILNGSIVLPKYDEKGKRITYTMTEEAINGYISRIEKGSQKLINEYNGGRKLKFQITKHWDGMDSTKEFPTIIFTLHQVIELTNGEFREFNKFEQDFKAVNDADYTVTFPRTAAEEKVLRYYSPVGTPYLYYITEKLANDDHEEVVFVDSEQNEKLTTYLAAYNGTNPKLMKVVLDENNSGHKLGFICQTAPLDTVLMEILKKKLSDEYTAEHNSNPTAEQLQETTDQYITALKAELKIQLNLNDREPTEKELQTALQEKLKDEVSNPDAAAFSMSETIQNTYKPDDTNFHGKINITKSWNKNSVTDHDDVKAYTFTLRRSNKPTLEKMFTITTIDKHSIENNPNAKPTIIPAPTFEVDMDSMDFIACSSYDDTLGTYTETKAGETTKYYIAKVKKENEVSANPIMIIISIADEKGNVDYNNQVMIRNLAVYRQDALKFIYSIEEANKSGYSLIKKSDSGKLELDPSPTTPSAPREMRLSNELDVFDLKINKSFGREYQDSDNSFKIQPIPADDYAQFFNDEYFKQLEFHIYRQTTNQPPEEIGYDGKAIKDNPSNLLTGKIILTGLQNSNENYGEVSTEATGETEAFTQRYAIIKNLPLTNAVGEPYIYWVKEVDNAQLEEDSDGNKIQKSVKHVSTYYSNGSAFEKTRDKNVNPVSYSVSGDSSETNITPEKNTIKEAYIQNVFEAKKISIKKYWLDNNNEDGMRPTELQVTITEQVPNGDTSAATIDFGRTLQNADSWSMEAALARYYFNGTTAINDLKYKISEETLSDYTLVTSAGTYGDTANHDPNTYTIPGTVDSVYIPLSDSVDFKPIGTGVTGEQTFNTLNLTNYKKPHKGDLTLTKKFDPVDEEFKADTHPSNLYFKLMSGDSVFTDYENLLVKVYKIEINEQNQEVDTEIITPSATGVITVPKNADHSYPKIKVTGLPIGISENGSVSANGTPNASPYQH